MTDSGAVNSTPRRLSEKSVYAVVVTYEPDVERLQRVLQAVAPQVHHLLIVDNSESDDAQVDAERVLRQAGETQTESPSPLQVHYHAAESNLGLSAAYNVAIGLAREACADYLLLLDQDSIVGDYMVCALVDGFARSEAEARELGQDGAPATVGPWYTDELTGRRSVVLRTGRWLVNYIKTAAVDEGVDLAQLPVMPTEMLISSGSLVPLSAFAALGELDDSLFIDHIDTDWCLRVRHSGGWMAVIPNAHMQHQLGDRVLRMWFGRWRLLPVHSPIRLYYTFRNSLWLYQRPHGHWRWVLFDLKRLLAVTLIHTLASGPRWPRYKMIARGIVDGVAGWWRSKPQSAN